MNSEAILALISDLVMQVHALRARVQELEGRQHGSQAPNGGDAATTPNAT